MNSSSAVMNIAANVDTLPGASIHLGSSCGIFFPRQLRQPPPLGNAMVTMRVSEGCEHYMVAGTAVKGSKVKCGSVVVYCSKLQCSAVQYSTVQYSTVQ